VPLAFAAGAVPFSNLMALWAKGVDLRSVGGGTVSGTALFEVAGPWPLVAVGMFEVAKGALGPVVAGRGHPLAAALSGGAAVAGHNWSPWLGWAGGRGISPALGALGVMAPVGAAVLMAGLVAGRLGGETALGCLVADALVVPVAARAHGKAGRRAAWAVLVPLVAKRMAGNALPRQREAWVYLWRLLFDRDTRDKAGHGTKEAGN
jgi:glycerol-3-phosphate acyltransferase PlsY